MEGSAGEMQVRDLSVGFFTIPAWPVSQQTTMIFWTTCVTTWPCLEHIYIPRGGDEDEGKRMFFSGWKEKKNEGRKKN